MAGGFGRIWCLVVVVAILMGCATAETHMVGDDLGWKVPPGGPIAYSVWADKQDFEIGDTLIFNWSGNHDVVKVSKSVFDNCSTTNVIETIQSTSPANFTLDANGTHYFICTVSNHCYFGQKVAVSIGDTGTAPPITATAFSVVLLALAFSLFTHI
ncbi:Blue copper protein [Actinidia chinensis var. chinensis]|uniref:Blue copper protein n=1 Tax=Actinidia chinensis var. chinensis TaxID=1590841 RepID=A0A2R6S1G0_ACTCC|nr:Blue copper protein [Actinidia chinensis var. chinensis]